MRTAEEILAQFGIRVRGAASGNVKTTCPNCSPTRKKKQDKCLSVLIDREGVQFNCWHCGWRGGKFYDDRPGDHRMDGGARNFSGHRNSYGRLQRQDSRNWRR